MSYFGQAFSRLIARYACEEDLQRILIRVSKEFLLFFRIFIKIYHSIFIDNRKFG